jgi:hypothetical protein
MCVLLKEIETAMSRPNSKKDWPPTINTIQSQMLLRSLSCIQIASKLYPASTTTELDTAECIDCNNNSETKTSNSKKHASHPLCCADIKSVLETLGYHFTTLSIMNSELRVLKTLDYRVRYLLSVVS